MEFICFRSLWSRFFHSFFLTLSFYSNSLHSSPSCQVFAQKDHKSAFFLLAPKQNHFQAWTFELFLIHVWAFLLESEPLVFLICYSTPISINRHNFVAPKLLSRKAKKGQDSKEGLAFYLLTNYLCQIMAIIVFPVLFAFNRKLC